MPYVSQEKKKKIADALKASGLPKTFKYTLAVDHHSELVLTIREAPATVLDDFIGHVDAYGNLNDLRGNEKNALERFEEEGYWDVNIFHMEKQFSGKTLKVIQKMLEVIKSAGEWFDKSDAMTDYFHTAFYITIKFGRWNKPVTFTGSRRRKPKVEPVERVVADFVAQPTPTFDPQPVAAPSRESLERVDEILSGNVVHVAFPRSEARDMEREIAKAELVRRGVEQMKATPAGSTLNDAALVTLAEAMLNVIAD